MMAQSLSKESFKADSTYSLLYPNRPDGNRRNPLNPLLLMLIPFSLFWCTDGGSAASTVKTNIADGRSALVT